MKMRENVKFNLISPGDTGGGYGVKPFICSPFVGEFVIAKNSAENLKKKYKY
jgi:hypothetical protein